MSDTIVSRKDHGHQFLEFVDYMPHLQSLAIPIQLCCRILRRP